MIRERRQQRGWSQEYLAEVTGLSVRTIQRAEQGKTIGLSSLSAIATALDVDIASLQSNTAVEHQEEAVDVSSSEQAIMERVRDIRGFYSHAWSYLLVSLFLVILNALTSPDRWWVFWPVAGWGIGVLAHGLSVFEVMDLWGDDWEKREIDKRLKRKS